MSEPHPLPGTFGMPVELRHVERELTQQLRGMRSDDTAPTQRVRMSNLVVYVNTQAMAEEIAEKTPELATVHPARILLLWGDSEASGRELSASVLVRCRLLTKYQQACSEQVTLYAPGPMIDRLPFAVRSLLIGDLPINLLWLVPIPPPLGGVLLDELGEPAQQILYDSLRWPDPVRGVATTAGWVEAIERTDPGRWRVASDLNWRRLKYWRRLVSQAVESLGDGQTVSEILVEHGPGAVVQAWLLASWLARRLGWRVVGGKALQGVELAWRFAAGPREVTVRVKRLPEGPSRINFVRLGLGAEGKEALNLRFEDESHLGIHPEGMEGQPRTLSVPPMSPAEVIGRQLSDRERDPVFRQSMSVAQAMAQIVLK